MSRPWENVNRAGISEEPSVPNGSPPARVPGSAAALRWLGLAGAVGLALSLLAIARVSGMRTPRPRTPLPVLFAIPTFTLTNQDGQVVTSTNLLGQVWVADVIFTRCAGPCPRMTQRMSEIQSALPPQAPVKLVTLTTDPAYDTPGVLKGYGGRFGASFDQWWFLTGDKPTLASLATGGFKFAATEIPEAERRDDADLFLHSTFYVLVDPHGRARGVYQYSDPHMKEQLLQDIGVLLREP